MKHFNSWLLCLLTILCTLPALAQERPYSEGPVAIVSSIKVMDGQFENYMEYLSKTWRRAMEEAKTAGMVTDYRVYSGQAHTADEPDLYLVVTYPNMATFDGMTEKMDPILAKVAKMDYRQADEASGKRTVMRHLVGEMMVRELVFK